MAAAASVALYMLLAWRYPLGPGLENPRASWATMVEPTAWNALLHLAIYAGAAGLFTFQLRLLLDRGLRRQGSSRQTLAVILLAWLSSSAALMYASPAGESHDVFDYLFRGRMMTEYGGNALVDVPADYSLLAPYARYVAWRGNVDTYGPVWEAASAGISSGVRQVARGLGWWDEDAPVCPESPESCRLLIAYVSGYRLLAVVLTGLSGWLIFSMVKQREPAMANAALAAWLLNPMTLVASALGGHNDAVLLILMVLCWWLLARGRPFLALVALILAAHVKLTALIWLPVCVIWMARRWGLDRTLKICLAGAVSGVLLSSLLYMPFGGWASLPRMLEERSALLANSIWQVLRVLFTSYWGWQKLIAHRIATGIPTVLFALGILLIGFKLLRRPSSFLRRDQAKARGPRTKDEGPLWSALTATSMLALSVGSFWFQPWYVLWAAAPASLLPGSTMTRVVVPWLAFGALSSSMAIDYLRNTLLEDAAPIWIPLVAVAVIWCPVLMAMGIRFLRHRTPRGAGDGERQ